MLHDEFYRKHVWANYCLLYHNEKLLDESVALQEFGIRNNSQVPFLAQLSSPIFSMFELMLQYLAFY